MKQEQYFFKQQQYQQVMACSEYFVMENVVFMGTVNNRQ